ncbi:hypothetical protein PINS_up004281 [Pythium insidiosum]|nr:hypothetical protein PINS_up004281 [Pythium insidiosum]
MCCCCSDRHTTTIQNDSLQEKLLDEETKVTTTATTADTGRQSLKESLSDARHSDKAVWTRAASSLEEGRNSSKLNAQDPIYQQGYDDDDESERLRRREEDDDADDHSSDEDQASTSYGTRRGHGQVASQITSNEWERSIRTDGHDGDSNDLSYEMDGKDSQITEEDEDVARDSMDLPGDVRSHRFTSDISVRSELDSYASSGDMSHQDSRLFDDESSQRTASPHAVEDEEHERRRDSLTRRPSRGLREFQAQDETEESAFDSDYWTRGNLDSSASTTSFAESRRVLETASQQHSSPNSSPRSKKGKRSPRAKRR